MQRKTQRKTIRYMPDKQERGQAPNNGLSVQTFITILGGTTGVFVALLWLAGRFYTTGYFNAMNIPSYHISYSIWEYSETSWLYLIGYFLNQIYKPLVLTASIFVGIGLVVVAVQKTFPRLKIFNALKVIETQVNKLEKGIIYVLCSILVLYVFYVFLLSLVSIKNSGQMDGQSAVLEKSRSVEIYSKVYLPLGQEQVVSNASSTLFHYSGLRLLIYNNGRYFLFRDVDPVTCKPAKVFILENSQDIYIVLGGVEPVATSCALTTP